MQASMKIESNNLLQRVQSADHWIFGGKVFTASGYLCMFLYAIVASYTYWTSSFSGICSSQLPDWGTEVVDDVTVASIIGDELVQEVNSIVA